MTLSLALTDLREAITDAVADTASLRTAKRQECIARARRRAAHDRGRRRPHPPDPLQPPLQRLQVHRRRAARSLSPRCAPAPRSGSRPTGPATSAGWSPRTSVWVSVADDGIGIKREDMPKLFQEFSQVDSSASRRAQGTGLGLALCKKFVEMHGGTIGADSVFGKGAAFWFLLPAEGPVRRTHRSRARLSIL